MVFIANHQPPEVLKPGKETLDFPSAAIAPQLPPVLRALPSSPVAMRCDHLNTAFLQETLIKTIAIVSLIANKTIGSVMDKAAIDGLLNQCHFMGRGTFNVSGDRKTSSVCDGHDLGAFAALRLADSKAPFFAGTKVPSMKASRMSMPPRSYRSCARSWTMRWNTPIRTHCWKRLWHVWYGGYRSGKSFQGAPVRKIHKIPFNTSRESRAGRPLGSLGGIEDFRMGSNRFHCSSVSSILILLHIQNVMASFFEMRSNHSNELTYGFYIFKKHMPW